MEYLYITLRLAQEYSSEFTLKFVILLHKAELGLRALNCQVASEVFGSRFGTSARDRRRSKNRVNWERRN